jgi:hypothetical protein
MYPDSLARLGRIAVAGLLLLCLNGCVGAIVGAVVDVGVEVVKVPFKVSKGIYDVVTDDDKEQAEKKKQAANAADTQK